MKPVQNTGFIFCTIPAIVSQCLGPGLFCVHLCCPRTTSKLPWVTINEMSGFLNPLVTKFRDVKFSFYSLKFRGVKLYFTQFYFPWNNGHYYLDLLNWVLNWLNSSKFHFVGMLCGNILGGRNLAVVENRFSFKQLMTSTSSHFTLLLE